MIRGGTESFVYCVNTSGPLAAVMVIHSGFMWFYTNQCIWYVFRFGEQRRRVKSLTHMWSAELNFTEVSHANCSLEEFPLFLFGPPLMDRCLLWYPSLMTREQGPPCCACQGYGWRPFELLGSSERFEIPSRRRGSVMDCIRLWMPPGFAMNELRRSNSGPKF